MELEEFKKLVKDALEHLYDTAYLEVHPLLEQITSVTTANRSTRAQGLRSALKDAIEELRPPEGFPAGSPEWRSYLVLRCRYVQGMTMGQVENELSLGRRQIQRETLKGLEGLASILWAKRRVETGSVIDSKTDSSNDSATFDNELDPLEMELNQWKLTLEKYDVHNLANDILWLLQSTIEQYHTNLQVDLPVALPPVFVDSTLTRQALFNILRAIVQQAPGPIRLTAASSDHFVALQILVPDCDPPVSTNEWQAAQRIIHDEGGIIDIENDPDLGCQISIRLPLAGRTQILVIDDNQAMQQLYERYLTPHHYEVQKAQNGAEALFMVDEKMPDLIILDVMMPTVDGWQVLRSLKQKQISEKIPVIICSVIKEPELAISLGARAYLKKPVDRLELLTTLERILHQ